MSRSRRLVIVGIAAALGACPESERRQARGPRAHCTATGTAGGR